MKKESFKKAFKEYLDALEAFAYTRGDGPYFSKDRDDAEENLERKREALDKEIDKM